ncbi:hypothetical protein QJQ45_002733 [Haematococcus lacustris]|nr:hypothetical protein QJQ45_002733 [Haematococcus lacustris]
MRTPPRRYSPIEHQICIDKTAELQAAGIVSPVEGPCSYVAAPVLPAKKDVHGHELRDSCYFSKLVMRCGFFQLVIAPTDRIKTTFWCGNKPYQSNRMPFGTRNAPTEYQCVMDMCIVDAGLTHCCNAYIDNLLVQSFTAEQHLQDVAAVLRMLQANRFKAHPDKSMFGADVVEIWATIARQAIHIVKAAIIPSLAYSFCVVPCTPGDLDLFDRAVNQCVKHKLNLPLGTPNAVIRDDIDKLGLGISSAAQEYHARNTTALVSSLQSADNTYAHISRCMLHKQITWLYAQAAKHGHRIPNLLQHILRARQLLHTTTANLFATHEGAPLYPKETKALGQLITQSASPLPRDIVSACITCLKSLGLAHPSELICQDNIHIMSGDGLRKRFGTKVKQKHIIALNRLTAMATMDHCPTATEAKTILGKRDTTLTLPADQRRIRAWAAGLTELTPHTTAHTGPRYTDIRAYMTLAKDTQPPTPKPTTATARSKLTNNVPKPPTAKQPTPQPRIGSKRPAEDGHTQADDRHTQTIPDVVTHIPIMTLANLSTWKADTVRQHKNEQLGIMLGAMYDHQESITAIDGWHWNGNNQESYYNVHWRPTIIEKWALQMYKKEGYTPAHTEDICRADAEHVCTCELCWEPKEDSPMCNNCMRAYHPACLAKTGLAGQARDDHWLCPVCAHGEDDLKTAMRKSVETDLIKAHWHPTTEPKPLILAHIDYTDKKNEYDADNSKRQEARRRPPDAALPEHTRQGLPDPHTWIPRCTDLHSRATFHTSPVNPQTDIVGTGRCEITLQNHSHITTEAMCGGSQGPNLPQHSLIEHVVAHDEAGRTVGLINKTTYQNLTTWLQHTPHPRDPAMELAALLRRNNTQSTPQPLLAAQNKAITTLHNTQYFPSTVQRWANPLTVRAETTTYWSPDINDTAYGAHHNCLLVRHTGLSTWNVPAEDALALKCIKHAIHSATMEEATATILLIPGKKGISYPKHIAMLKSYPEYCQHLATIPLDKPKAATKSCKHATLLTYIVWNKAGQQLVTKGNPPGWLANTATALHPRPERHPKHNQPSKHVQPTQLPSGHYKHTHLPADRELPATGHMRQPNQIAPPFCTTSSMVIPNWRTVTYTDGSCMQGTDRAPSRKVGAGVYTPVNDERLTIALPDHSTINRAELAAIHAAIKSGATHIATDSLCSIYQIRRALANPMSLRTHPHRDILADIATLIMNSRDTIHLRKVRAHSGIIGNEAADTLAKHAAMYPEQAHTQAPHEHTEQQTWLSATTETGTTIPLPDCRHSVRTHMRAKHKLGLANQDSIYYQMSQDIARVAAKGSCERVMLDPGIPTAAQRTALLYRTGGLYNQKLAMRWGKTADDRCPLCGEADSATHLLSGCTRTAALVQERHNGAGRLITKAISKGSQGGYITYTDIGSHARGEQNDMDLPNTTLSDTLAAIGLPTAHNTTTRPDIIMVSTKSNKRNRDKDESNKHVTILEIKYCADSRWTEQLEKASTQHAALATAIREAGNTVTIRPILLGIGGITYEAHTKQHMRELVVFFFFFCEVRNSCNAASPLPTSFKNDDVLHNFISSAMRDHPQPLCHLFGEPLCFDAAIVGSFAHRVRNHWTNLYDTVVAACVLVHANRGPIWVQDILDPSRTTPQASILPPPPAFQCEIVGQPQRARPTLVATLGSYAFKTNGSGLMLNYDGTTCEPTMGEREGALGYNTGATTAFGVTQAQRFAILGRCMDAYGMQSLLAVAHALYHPPIVAITTQHPPSPASCACMPGGSSCTLTTEHATPVGSATSPACLATTLTAAVEETSDIHTDTATLRLVRSGAHPPALSATEPRRGLRPAVVERIACPVSFDDLPLTATILLQRSTVLNRETDVAMGNIRIVQHRDTLHYALTHSGSYKPVARHVCVDLAPQSNSLQLSDRPKIFRVMSVGTVSWQRGGSRHGQVRVGHGGECVQPCHLPPA